MNDDNQAQRNGRWDGGPLAGGPSVVQVRVPGPGADPGRRGVRRVAQDLERDDRSAPRPDRALHGDRRRRAGRSLRATTSAARIRSRRRPQHCRPCGLRGWAHDRPVVAARGVGGPGPPHGARAGRLHTGRPRSGDAAPWAGRRAGFRIGHRHRRTHRGGRIWVSHPSAWLDLRQPRLHGGGDRRRRGPACVRGRERGPVLGAPWRRRQLRDRHVVRVPALSGRTRNPGRRDRLARRGRQDGPRRLPRVQRRGAARADQRRRAAHRAAGTLAAEGDPRQADRRHLRLPFRNGGGG